jgi:rubredoxin
MSSKAHIVTVYCQRRAWQTTHHFERGNIDVSDKPYKSWLCIICGWVYDEEAGSPEDGIAPGTRWEDVPDYWVCPDCGAGKEDFEMIEI